MSNGAVEEHYATEGIAARVLTALRNVNGPDVAITPDTLAPIDHFHRRGVIETEELAAVLQPEASDHLLDIGCGIGGPARWIAAKYGCLVTGVDLTPEFCVAARELNMATGLADRVRILDGSALALPMPDDSFDHAYAGRADEHLGQARRFPRSLSRASVRRLVGPIFGRRRLCGSAALSAAMGHHDRHQFPCHTR
jgi:SAM-dependent methyltransferase